MRMFDMSFTSHILPKYINTCQSELIHAQVCKIHTSRCGESYRAYRSDTSMSSSTILTQRRKRIGSVHEILHISP